MGVVELTGNYIRIDCPISLSENKINGAPVFDTEGSEIQNSSCLEFLVDEVADSDRHGPYVIATATDENRNLTVAFKLQYAGLKRVSDRIEAKFVHYLSTR